MTIINPQVFSAFNSVNCVAWAPAEAGLKLAVASADGTVTIINHIQHNSSWEIQQKISAHSQGINAVSWCPYIQEEDLV